MLFVAQFGREVVSDLAVRLIFAHGNDLILHQFDLRECKLLLQAQVIACFTAVVLDCDNIVGCGGGASRPGAGVFRKEAGGRGASDVHCGCQQGRVI